MTVLFYCFFRLKVKKSFMKKLSLDGVRKRGFNWQKFKYLLMPQFTDLFCLRILIFSRSNVWASFNLLPHKYWGSTCIVFQWRKVAVSPLEVWLELCLKKSFHGRCANKFFSANLWGRPVLYRGLTIKLCQRCGSFTNAFSSNLNTVNRNIFFSRKLIYTWR